MVSDACCSGEDGLVPDTGCDGKCAPESLTDLDGGVGKNWPDDNRRDSSGVDASGHGGARELATQPTSLTDADGELGRSLDRLCVGGENPSEASPTTARKAGPAEFELLKVIGMGAFGKVLQVRSRRNGQILAMKCISKKMLARRNHISYMQAERDIMTKVMHPFVVTLQCAFQTEHKLFLVMEYLPGGELFFHLSKKGLFLEEYARFYAAEMVLALEHLHSKGIIHRDLKPENLLLGANGHICVTDFGLAKELSHAEDEGLKTICGTNEYMAPEMILRKGYGKAVDWWSMGALVYEMTAGYPPFQGKTPKDLNRKILNERVSLPKWLSPTAHQVLRGFLERNVSRRLGAKKTTMFDIGGATAVKHHAFFEGIDWAKLIALQVEPPLKPELISTTDTSNFSAEFVDMALPRSLSQESMMSHGGTLGPPGADAVKGMFRGFSFVADTFIDEDNWQQGEGDGFSYMPGGKDGPDASAAQAGGAFAERTPQKKVKGKRIRKKGKAKEMPVGALIEGAPATVVVASEPGSRDGTPPISAAAATAAIEKDVLVVCGRPAPQTHTWKDVFVREPVSGAESKPSALAAMLAEQKQKAPSTHHPVSSINRPQRPNVWGASNLPAPAPVPTPAGPPRAQGRSVAVGSTSKSGRRIPVKELEPLPGRREQGSTFVWKRPV